MSIVKKPFGQLPCGASVEEYTLTNRWGASVSVLNYGGIITRLIVPDQSGQLGDVVLGYDSIAPYIDNPGYLGALIGRVANRINRGRISVGGRSIQLAANSNGHHLHGGDVGFDKKIWSVETQQGEGEDRLILRYTSPDGEENYPGRLEVTATYHWTDGHQLKLRYEAISDRDTPCNLTNHSYFNLDGVGDIEDHLIEIPANSITEVDEDSIPTGQLYPVDGTPFDLRQAKRVGDGHRAGKTDRQMKNGGGYDHNFVLGGQGLRRAALVTAPLSGRTMEVFTDMPAVQFYAGNMLDTPAAGKSGARYGFREGLCLETQFFPDSINHPNFPDSLLRAGQKYDFTTIYAFG